MKASAYLVNEKKAYTRIKQGIKLKGDKPEVTAFDAGSDKIKATVDKILTDGYPVPKVADHFILTVVCDANGNITVICKAYESQYEETPLVAEE